MVQSTHTFTYCNELRTIGLKNISITKSSNSTTDNIVSQVKLRFLCPSDRPIVQELCKQWFPISYPETWYEELTTSQKFYALAATLEDTIVGLLVAEIKPYFRCNKEDADLLHTTNQFTFSGNIQDKSRVAYILTLGVVHQYRRRGIATILLRSLVNSLTTNPLLEDCKAIYLHVLSTNTPAMRFYERCAFQQHKYLPLYYHINNAAADGYSYVLYINGGRPPQNVFSRLLTIANSLLVSTSPLQWTGRWCRALLTSLVNRLYSSDNGRSREASIKYKGEVYTC